MSERKSTKDILYKEFIDWADEEFKNIDREKTFNRNFPFAFIGLGDKGELFTLQMFPNSIGSSSKGGVAFDNKEVNDDNTIKTTREVKFVSLDGCKKCKSCKSKVPRFQEICIYCNNSEFQLIKDSRWGISASAHNKYNNDKYKLNEYILYISEYNNEKKCINLKCFKILSSNQYFGDYVQNQYEHGKDNTCNLMPYSWDFYLSGPIMLFDVDIYKTKIEEHFWNLDNIEIVKVPKKLIEKNKQCCTYTETIDTEGIDYNTIIKHCKMKKKNLGKKRGTVTRK